jgi:hypothetical protein
MKLRVSKKVVAGGILAAALSASMAAQANLVTNGGFETGDFTGWTTSIDPAYDGVDSQAPQAGTYAAFFGNPNGTSTISQTLTTVAGTTYTVSFWLMAEADVTGNSIPNSFSFTWGGAAGAPPIVDSAPFGYTEFQYQLVASSASTTLAFSFSDSPAFWDFDSVDVTANVPEPASLALVFGALGSLLWVMRRPAAKTRAVRITG